MPKSLVRVLSVLVVLLAALLPAAPGSAYVGRCPTCGTVDKVEAIRYEAVRDGAAVGAIVASIAGRAPGAKAGDAGGLIGRTTGRRADGPGERGTRLEIRMDKGGIRTIEVHGDPRIYRGDRVRVFKDRVELL